MIRNFAKNVNSGEKFAAQNRQYSEKIILSDTVSANSTKLGRASISNLGHFLCLYITGSFTCLTTKTVGETSYQLDDGLTHLRGQLIDGAGQRKLFSERIPLDLILSPGRRRSATAENNLLDVEDYANAAYNANTLFYPVEFEYLFSANSEILLDVSNDSNYANSYDIVFHGVRVLSVDTVRGV